MVRVKHKEWKNDFCESFFKAGGTAGIQAEVAEEDPAPERQFVFPGLFCVIGNFVPITQKKLREDAHLAVR